MFVTNLADDIVEYRLPRSIEAVRLKELYSQMIVSLGTLLYQRAISTVYEEHST